MATSSQALFKGIVTTHERECASKNKYASASTVSQTSGLRCMGSIFHQNQGLLFLLSFFWKGQTVGEDQCSLTITALNTERHLLWQSKA